MDKSGKEKEKVLHGKSDFLFLTNDTNHVLDRISGKIKYTPECREKWQEEIQRRKSHAQQFGYFYKFIIPPNKHCVYQEFLPDDIKISPDRIVSRLAAEFPDTIIYPYDFFREKKDTLLYHKTDTHWNELGAILFMNSIAESFGSKKLEYEIFSKRIYGDLGSKLEPPVSSTTFAVNISAAAHKIYDNNFPFRGGHYITQTDDRSLPTGIAFCDSFFNTIWNIIASYFYKLYVFVAPIFDTRLIEKINPDVVLSETVERFIDFPVDREFEQFIYEKFFTSDFDHFSGLPVPFQDPEALLDCDYKLLDSYKTAMNDCNEGNFARNSYVYLCEKAPQYLHYNIQHQPERLIWSPSQSNHFTTWAAGFVPHERTSPRAIAVNLIGTSQNNSLTLDFYKIPSDINITMATSINLESLDKVHTEFFLVRDLFIYANSQEVVLNLHDFSVLRDTAYLFVLGCDNMIGCLRKESHYPKFCQFFNGYFSMDDPTILKPLAKGGAISWRFII